jgi:hypothetical protein
MFMFEVTSNQGNALYLEDINITTNNSDPALSVYDLENATIGSFEVYPNPFVDDATIEYSTMKNENVKLEMIDVLGKNVVLFDKYHPEGNYSVNLSEYANLPKGFYTLKLTTGSELFIKKIIKE